MGMNNIYYRFLHLSSNEKYKTMPARLRMNAIRRMASIMLTSNCGALRYRRSTDAERVLIRMKKLCATKVWPKKKFLPLSASLQFCMRSLRFFKPSLLWEILMRRRFQHSNSLEAAWILIAPLRFPLLFSLLQSSDCTQLATVRKQSLDRTRD